MATYSEIWDMHTELWDVPPAQSENVFPPVIALEEHFLSDETSVSNRYSKRFASSPGLIDKLNDLGSLRLAEMDQGRVTLQVISHAAGLLSPTECENANNNLAEAIAKHERFAGFAVLPVCHPQMCASELQRSVNDLGFVGALIDNHADGQFYDRDDYFPLWQKAVELDVPVYLHPTWIEADIQSMYDATEGSTDAVDRDWHSRTGNHVLRLFASGLFDRLPTLKVIVGYFGEMLPYMLQRVEQMSKAWGERQRSFREIYEENIWITTSGVWGLDPLRGILANTPITHILYSVDYPMVGTAKGLRWLEELMRSGLVDRRRFEMIAYKNAEALLRIRVPHAAGKSSPESEIQEITLSAPHDL